MPPKQIESIFISPRIQNEEADVNGVMAFSFEMNRRLTDKRHQGKGGWQLGAIVSMESLRKKLQKCVDEDRMIDAANYCMMIFHRKRMESYDVEGT